MPELKTDFRWKLDNNLFIQSGTVTRPDGRRAEIELIFRKVETSNAYPDNPALGTWKILSSVATMPDGQTLVENAPGVQMMKIITPTHWMAISTRNGKFANAVGGTYSIRDGKLFPKRAYSAQPVEDRRHIVLDLQRQGNKLIFNGTVTTPDNKTFTRKDVAELME